MKFNDSMMDQYVLEKKKYSKPCFICKENTHYIDFCSNAYICSTECFRALGKKIAGTEI